MISASIELPLSGETLASGFGLVLGWAYDPAGPVRSIILRINDEDAGCAILNYPSDTAARRFPDQPRAAQSGWRAYLDFRRYAGQSVRLEAVCITAASEAHSAAGVEFQIAPDGDIPRRPCAVFTMVKNEARRLPVWLNYYKKHFGSENLFILDHGSTDGSTTGISERALVIPVHRPITRDHTWIKTVVENFQRFLLNSYEAVIYTDADEIIVPDPSRYAGLSDYVRAMTQPVARCTGFNIVHYPEEAPLDFAAPILAQRRFMHAAPQYNKTLISRVPLHWELGFHTSFEFDKTDPDPDLALFHLHRADYEFARAWHEESAKGKWLTTDKERQLGRQFFIYEPEEFRKWFYEDPDLGHPRREEIPTRFKSAF